MSMMRAWPSLVAVGMLLAHAPASTPTSPSIPAGGKAALSQFLSEAVARGHVPGVVALVVNRDGVLYHDAAGQLDVARGVEMRPDAIYRIASMTKPITSVAVMMLVEGGKLALDDPVSSHLPDFDGRQVISTFHAADGRYQTRPASRPMTVRHLLAHTSGLGYAIFSPTVARLMQGTQKSEPDLPLLHDPGDRWTYGVNTRVLGHLVEKVSGQPLDVFVRTRIFEPLKMTETTWVVPPDNVSRVVTLHQRRDGTLVEQPNAPALRAPVEGDRGLFSTAGDYARFLRMLLNGGRLDGAMLLSEGSVRLMGQNQIGAVMVEEQPAVDTARARPFPLGAGRDKFGLGFQIAALDERYSNLRRPGSLSWAGINNTHFWIDPTREIAVVVLMQVLPFYDEASIRILREFEALVYRYLR
jgi:CubicO group peptidase (beta-lactamase class C family)